MAKQGRTNAVGVALVMALGIAACANQPSHASHPTRPNHAGDASALSAQSAGHRMSGHVSGTLRMIGGPAPGTNVGIPGTIYAYRNRDLAGSPAATARTDGVGRFDLELRAGVYYLAASSPRFSISPTPSGPPCRAGHAVTITAGGAGSATVVCPVK